MDQRDTRAESSTAPLFTESDELRLRGGLRGRMAGAFGTLQSSVDALQRYLAGSTVPTVYETAQGMLEEMCARIAYLERLSENAASLATGAMTRGAEELAPLELAGYLTEMAACANETLALREFPARVVFADHSGQPQVWIRGSTGLLDGIVSNLLSNLLQAKWDGTMWLTLEEGRILQYSDNGPGMDPEEAGALLEQGRPSSRILSRGAIGLLLVRDYAAAMGWTVQVERGQGMAFRFSLPPFELPPRVHRMQDSGAKRDLRGEIMAAHLNRELDGVFGPERSR